MANESKSGFENPVDPQAMKRSLTKALDRLLEGCYCPGDIADKLIGMGITGTISNPTYCPLAKYLSAEVGYPVETYRTQAAAGDVYIPLPDVVSFFLGNFDCGVYQELRRSRQPAGV